jgi:hypothetical protein
VARAQVRALNRGSGGPRRVGPRWTAAAPHRGQAQPRARVWLKVGDGPTRWVPPARERRGGSGEREAVRGGGPGEANGPPTWERKGEGRRQLGPDREGRKERRKRKRDLGPAQDGKREGDRIQFKCF